MENKKIVAVDFDGTLSTNKWPETGEPIKGARETIQALRNNGCCVFLYTMRDGESLKKAQDWLKENDIELDQTDGYSPEQFSKSPKQYADLIIDDTCIGCPLVKLETGEKVVDWEKVSVKLFLQGYITEEEARKV